MDCTADEKINSSFSPFSVLRLTPGSPPGRQCNNTTTNRSAFELHEDWEVANTALAMILLDGKDNQKRTAVLKGAKYSQNVKLADSTAEGMINAEIDRWRTGLKRKTKRLSTAQINTRESHHNRTN